MTQLWNQLPAATFSGATCSIRLSPSAYATVITSRTIDLARKAKAANPDDFQARLRLVEILLASPDPAIAWLKPRPRFAAPSTPSAPIPDRWLT